MTTDKIFGILKVDYPELTDDEFRAIQTGEEDVLPDGTTVAEYAAAVERLKSVPDVETASQPEQITIEQEETAGDATEPDETFDSDEIDY